MAPSRLGIHITESSMAGTKKPAETPKLYLVLGCVPPGQRIKQQTCAKTKPTSSISLGPRSAMSSSIVAKRTSFSVPLPSSAKQLSTFPGESATNRGNRTGIGLNAGELRLKSRKFSDHVATQTRLIPNCGGHQ